MSSPDFGPRPPGLRPDVAWPPPIPKLPAWIGQLNPTVQHAIERAIQQLEAQLLREAAAIPNKFPDVMYGLRELGYYPPPGGNPPPTAPPDIEAFAPSGGLPSNDPQAFKKTIRPDDPPLACGLRPDKVLSFALVEMVFLQGLDAFALGADRCTAMTAKLNTQFNEINRAFADMYNNQYARLVTRMTNVLAVATGKLDSPTVTWMTTNQTNLNSARSVILDRSNAAQAEYSYWQTYNCTRDALSLALVNVGTMGLANLSRAELFGMQQLKYYIGLWNDTVMNYGAWRVAIETIENYVYSGGVI